MSAQILAGLKSFVCWVSGSWRFNATIMKDKSKISATRQDGSDLLVADGGRPAPGKALPNNPKERKQRAACGTNTLQLDFTGL